jgi:hypothetical protein
MTGAAATAASRGPDSGGGAGASAQSTPIWPDCTPLKRGERAGRHGGRGCPGGCALRLGGGVAAAASVG